MLGFLVTLIYYYSTMKVKNKMFQMLINRLIRTLHGNEKIETMNAVYKTVYLLNN